MVTKFNNSNIPLIVKDITSPIGIPTFNASSIEWITENYGYLAEGHGTHPDARIALLRAITEVSQTRMQIFKVQGTIYEKSHTEIEIVMKKRHGNL